MENKKIVIISTESWGKVFTSKLHYANYLAKNNTVFFIEPVTTPWRIKNIFKIPISIKCPSNNLFIVNYGNPLPRLNKLPKFLQSFFFKKLIKILSGSLEINSQIDIVWSFDPRRFFRLNDWKSVTTIAHWVEIYDNPVFDGSAPYKKDQILSADIVLAVSEKIVSQINQIRRDSVYYIQHGSDLESFTLADKKNVSLPSNNGKLKAGLTGNFQISIDFDETIKIFSTFKEIDFYLIGPYTQENLGKIDTEIINPYIKKLRELPNVFLLGSINSNELMNYLLNFDINIVPYSKHQIYRHINPHKIMGYLYAGGIIVTNYIDEYKDKTDLLLMDTDGNKNLFELFYIAVENIKDFNSNSNVEKRKKYAIDNSYMKQISRVNDIINAHKQN